MRLRSQKAANLVGNVRHALTDLMRPQKKGGGGMAMVILWSLLTSFEPLYFIETMHKISTKLKWRREKTPCLHLDALMMDWCNTTSETSSEVRRQDDLIGWKVSSSFGWSIPFKTSPVTA